MTTDCTTHKVVVKGEKADPLKVLERVQKKSHRQVELLSPIPKPPAPEEKKPEEKEAPKAQEKKEEVRLFPLLRGFDFSATLGSSLFILISFFCPLFFGDCSVSDSIFLGTKCCSAAAGDHGGAQREYALRGLCSGKQETHPPNERCELSHLRRHSLSCCLSCLMIS